MSQRSRVEAALLVGMLSLTVAVLVALHGLLCPLGG